uniref:Uncharacterized protein n=1 Tax=Timema poppense TaxID=170557 RepID=A0A7R9DHR6_TIMPO|nr:unnamed protein product [Timema poppensis]
MGRSRIGNWPIPFWFRNYVLRHFIVDSLQYATATNTLLHRLPTSMYDSIGEGYFNIYRSKKDLRADVGPSSCPSRDNSKFRLLLEFVWEAVCQCSSPMASLELTDSSQLTTDSQHLGRETREENFVRFMGFTEKGNGKKKKNKMESNGVQHKFSLWTSAKNYGPYQHG